MLGIAQSPANIAFVKHWGTQKNGNMAGPSLSMNLSNCHTTTRVQLLRDKTKKSVIIDTPQGQIALKKEANERNGQVFAVLDAALSHFGLDYGYRVDSVNSFPTKAGIASSASGFSALVWAASAALKAENKANNFTFAQKQALVRLGGSFSALRSLKDRFVSLKNTENSKSEEKEVITSLKEAKKWDLVDLVVVLEDKMKEKGSDSGHDLARGSVFQQVRLQGAEKRMQMAEKAIKEHDFGVLSQIIEEEAVLLHGVMLSSNPEMRYMTQKTTKFILNLQKKQREGLTCAWTLDAGANPHIICTPEAKNEVQSVLASLHDGEIIENVPCEGVKIVD